MAVLLSNVSLSNVANIKMVKILVDAIVERSKTVGQIRKANRSTYM